MKKLLLGACIAVFAATGVQATSIDFDDNSLAPDTYYDPMANTTWTSRGFAFEHTWSFDCCWGNFTYSNRVDTTTSGFSNDRSAITGDGIGAGQDNYAVGFAGNGGAIVEFANPQTVLGGYFTNTTYTYNAMKFGDDGNSPAFVKGPFGDGDFFRLTVTGLDAQGADLGALDFLLADGADVSDTWEWFELAGLGEVYGLRFDLASSDNGSFGMNTPAYFAMDSLSVVPLPAAAWLFVSALGLLGLRRLA